MTDAMDGFQDEGQPDGYEIDEGRLMIMQDDKSHRSFPETLRRKGRFPGTTKQKLSLALCLSLAVNAILLLLYVCKKTSQMEPKGWIRPETVYGLVHIAKTAGTEINGLLANQYERVCGNKGYSYDAYLANERVRHHAAQCEKHPNRHGCKGKQVYHSDLGETITKVFPSYTRNSPSHKFMQEIRWQDCDYVALEIQNTGEWVDIAAKIGPMELHVPCREPLNHLMSQCNHFHHSFDCEASEEEIMKNIQACTANLNGRFDHRLREHPDISLKCFEPMPPSDYVDYMGQILQPKRIPSDYFHRDSNLPRHKEDECVWKQSPEFHEKIRRMLLEMYEYYSFCEACMGTADELDIPRSAA